MQVALLTTVHKNCEVTGAGQARGFQTRSSDRKQITLTSRIEISGKGTGKHHLMFASFLCTSLRMGDVSHIQELLLHCMIGILLFYEM